MKVLGLILTLALVGCNNVISKADDKPDPGTGSQVVNYERVRAVVFIPYGCIKCHGTVADYSVETRDEAIKSSKLCEYLEKGYMPPKGAVPTADEAKMVCDWIAAGAP